MKILVDRLGDEPTVYDFVATPAWWAEQSGSSEAEALGVASDLAVTVSARRMGADLYLEGEVSGELAPTCSRCLGRYRQPVREPFRLVLEPAGDRVPADPEGAAALDRSGVTLSDELEAGWFRGSEIDLAAFVQEQISLLLPVQPLCREDCRGLCPSCGVDRNQESCDCAATPATSPFAALQGLRDELAGERSPGSRSPQRGERGGKDR